MPNRRERRHPPKNFEVYVLEQFNALEADKWRQFSSELLRIQWDWYIELAFQRREIKEEIRDSLLGITEPFAFSGWQRVVKAKWSLRPLSAAGSIIDPGGRFNIGEIDEERFPVFHALNFSEDKKTALCESILHDVDVQGYTPVELALASPESRSNFSVSGNIESVINLKNLDNLQTFVDLIKNFKLSQSLLDRAKRLKYPLKMIRTLNELLEAILDKNWRQAASLYDIPAPSQIFGHLVYSAGIEGIVFPSRFTGCSNLAVFPKNFHRSDSSIELDDETPPEYNICRRLDRFTWKRLC